MNLTNPERWTMYAGGVTAAEGKHGYDVQIPGYGKYAIQPLTHPCGQHKGYSVAFYDTEGRFAAAGDSGMCRFIVDINGDTCFHRSTAFPLRLARMACQNHYNKYRWRTAEPCSTSS